MASTVQTYNHTKQLVREFGLDGKTLKLALITSAHTPDMTDTQFADISGDEVSGTNYTAGGNTLDNVVVNADGSVDMDDETFTNVTVTFRYGLIYISGTVDSKVNPPLFLYLYDDTPADIVVVASDFVHVVASGGVF